MIGNIAIALGANALVLGALVYLVKSLIGHRLQKDIAEFKADLQLAYFGERDRPFRGS